MTLLDALLMVNQAGNGSQQLTDLAVGTVETISPLSIRLDVSQAALMEPVIYLTASVVEKKLSTLKHRHTYGGTSRTSYELSEVFVTENGEPLPYDEEGITLNRGLAVGDKVLLLSVQKGQKYIVLSRLF